MGKDNKTPDRIQAVWNILGGEEGVDRLLAGKLKLVETKPREFTVWKTVTLGRYKNPQNYRAALTQANMKISGWATDILDRISCRQKNVDLDLVVMSVSDLGFKNGARYADICAKAIELGLKLCPAEVGPALRLEYGDQIHGGWVYITMEAIDTRQRDSSIFEVWNTDGNLWLNAQSVKAVVLWGNGGQFVFVLPKKQQ
jgi:hypothetical protein